MEYLSHRLSLGSNLQHVANASWTGRTWPKQCQSNVHLGPKFVKGAPSLASLKPFCWRLSYVEIC